MSNLDSRYVTRWKTRTLAPADVATWLNNPANGGWTIHESPVPIYGGRKVLILCYRRVCRRAVKV